MTTAIVALPTPQEMDSKTLGMFVQDSIIGAATKLATLKPYVEELWLRFERGNVTILGCSNKKDFCLQVLERTRRAVQYMLAGGNPGNAKRSEMISLPEPQPQAIDEPLQDGAATDAELDGYLVDHPSNGIMISAKNLLKQGLSPADTASAMAGMYQPYYAAAAVRRCLPPAEPQPTSPIVSDEVNLTVPTVSEEPAAGKPTSLAPALGDTPAHILARENLFPEYSTRITPSSCVGCFNVQFQELTPNGVRLLSRKLHEVAATEESIRVAVRTRVIEQLAEIELKKNGTWVEPTPIPDTIEVVVPPVYQDDGALPQRPQVTDDFPSKVKVGDVLFCVSGPDHKLRTHPSLITVITVTAKTINRDYPKNPRSHFLKASHWGSGQPTQIIRVATDADRRTVAEYRAAHGLEPDPAPAAPEPTAPKKRAKKTATAESTALARARRTQSIGILRTRARHIQFLDRAESDELFQKMMAEPWTASDPNFNGDSGGIAQVDYGRSYQEHGGGAPNEIIIIPLFLRKLADRVEEIVGMPVNYVQAHKKFLTSRTGPHPDPTGMIVPMLSLGQEHAMRIGGYLSYGYMMNQLTTDAAMKAHEPAATPLMVHGSLLIFDGPVYHSMYEAALDPQFNANGYDCRITLLFRYTTDAMREYGPAKSKEHGGLEQYKEARDKWRTEHKWELPAVPVIELGPPIEPTPDAPRPAAELEQAKAGYSRTNGFQSPVAVQRTVAPAAQPSGDLFPDDVPPMPAPVTVASVDEEYHEYENEDEGYEDQGDE
jgi:hypothetical protein